VVALLTPLDQMVNKNYLGLRLIALKSLSELIDHCKTTKVVDEPIKKTRIGLQRISLDYVQTLSKLYSEPQYDAQGKEILVPTDEKH
jgi:hypothetical protein